MGDGGKGSSPRPFSVDHDTFSNNWENVFGKKKKPVDNAQNEQYNNDQLLEEDTNKSNFPGVA